MNDDLAAWADQDQGGKGATEKTAVSGPCHQCANPATAACLRCKTRVCARHHHVMYGLCLRCTAAREEAAQPDLRDVLDVPWVDL